jgi:chemotaxis protein methyltransferase CheR
MADISNRTAQNIPSLGEGDYERFSRLLLEHCGLNFSESRRAELELGVRHAFAASTCADLDEYYRLMQDPARGRMDLDRLVNATTISETHFFRDTAQFDAIFHHVLPQIIESRRFVRTLRIWSAGCASGEEPYSIAMLLRELLPDVDEWAITILGTDINTESLQRARKAVFGEWAFREERAKEWRPRYFRPPQPGGGNRYKLIPQVQRMVSFGKLNLSDGDYPSYSTNTTFMDLILCRNVTIYFSEPVTRQVIERFYNCLVDGGWLVVGHSEPSLYTYRRFQPRNYPDTIVYQRTGQPTALPMDWDLSPAGEAAPVPPVKPDTGPITLLPSASAAQADPFERAQELLEYGHSEQARDVLLKQVKLRPGHAPTCALLGQAYANLGQWQEAEQWCRQAVRYNNLQLDAYYTLALVMQHQGQLDQAIGAMKKVVYIDRNHVLGHFGLADLYHSNGQLPQACKSLDNARRLLERCADDQIIPGSGGIVAGRLRETAVHEQQQWGAEAASVNAGGILDGIWG